MRLIIFTILTMLSVSALAKDVGYDVEVIIFEDTTGRYLNSENWSVELPDINDKQTESDEPAAGKSGFFKFLDKKDYQLNTIADKLVRNPDYRILSHMAWKQKGLDEPDAFYVDLKQLDSTGNGTQIEGRARLVMSRYLHFSVDMELLRPVSTQYTNDASGTNSPAYNRYPVHFERRMRSREIHYLDHPLCGAIVLATPFEIKPEKAPQPAKPPASYKTL